MTMDQDNRFQALNTERVKNMTLEELKGAIYKDGNAIMARSEFFTILMAWLNEQIKQDIITQQQSLLAEFIELLLMPNSSGLEPFTWTEIDEAFDRWLGEEAIENPAYRRRYLITKQDMQRLCVKGRRFPQSLRGLSLCDAQYRDQDVVTSKEITDEFREDNNGKDLRSMEHTQRPTLTEVIEADDGEFHQSNDPMIMDTHRLGGIYAQNYNQDERMVLPETIITDNGSETKMTQKSTRKRRKTKGSKVYGKPPGDYVCRRCSKPGKTSLRILRVP